MRRVNPWRKESPSSFEIVRSGVYLWQAEDSVVTHQVDIGASVWLEKCLGFISLWLQWIQGIITLKTSQRTGRDTLFSPSKTFLYLVCVLSLNNLMPTIWSRFSYLFLLAPLSFYRSLWNVGGNKLCVSRLSDTDRWMDVRAIRYPNNSESGPDPVLSSFGAFFCTRKYFIRGWRKKRDSNH